MFLFYFIFLKSIKQSTFGH